jgi:hypothetical protein
MILRICYAGNEGGVQMRMTCNVLTNEGHDNLIIFDNGTGPEPDDLIDVHLEYRGGEGRLTIQRRSLPSILAILEAFIKASNA